MAGAAQLRVPLVVDSGWALIGTRDALRLPGARKPRWDAGFAAPAPVP